MPRVIADGKREGTEMRRRYALARVTGLTLALSVILSAAGSGAAYATDWKGPGWYEVLYTMDSGFMIWSGPYADENACKTYVQGRFNDPAYAENMRKKYGPIGDHDHGFEISCIEMKTAADAPPE